MSFLFTPAPNRQTHVKHSPSWTMERGEPLIRAPQPLRGYARSSFSTNGDTGIDSDGELKSGFLTGDLQAISPSPDSTKSFEALMLSATQNKLNNRRSSTSTTSPMTSSSPQRLSFTGQEGRYSFSSQMSRRQTSAQSSRASSPSLKAQREAIRRARIRQAGGLVHCGTIPVLLAVMTICAMVILFVWLHIR